MSLRRRCARIALTLISIALVAGCPARDIAKVPIAADVVEQTKVPLDDNRDMDILFVIDNSNSMANEQDSLRANFPAIIDVIRSAENQPSIHFGVISSDVGGGQLCPGDGDEGLLKTGTRCPATNDGSSFLYDRANPDGTRSTNYDGDLNTAFSCLADLGTGGCGFEQPLESVKRALDNPTNAAFFRDDAYLAIIFVTDEDDCSVRTTEILSDTGGRAPDVLNTDLGAVDSFRCFEFGVQCDQSGRGVGIRENCIPNEDSDLVNDVASYIEHLKGFKRSPSQLLVAAIAGDLEPIAVEMRDTTFYDFQVPQLAYSCEGTGLGEAVAPIRLSSYVNAFDRRTLESLCQNDLTGAVQQIANLIDDLLGPPCLQGELADISPAPGLQPDCVITEVVDAGLDNESETRLPACDNPGTPENSSTLPCYYLFENAAECSAYPSQLAVDIIYAEGVVVPPLTEARISCVGISPL